MHKIIHTAQGRLWLPRGHLRTSGRRRLPQLYMPSQFFLHVLPFGFYLGKCWTVQGSVADAFAQLCGFRAAGKRCAALRLTWGGGGVGLCAQRPIPRSSCVAQRCRQWCGDVSGAGDRHLADTPRPCHVPAPPPGSASVAGCIFLQVAFDVPNTVFFLFLKIISWCRNY